MTRRLLTALVGVGCVLALTGCDKSGSVRDELFRVRDRNKAQMDILKKSNELVNRELNDVKEQVQDLQDSNDRLTTQLSDFASRPEEIKLEIITEVNTRFAAIANGQNTFKDEVNATFETKTSEIEQKMLDDLAELDATLVHHAEFVHFVSSEQDSINRVFAGRFDSRPWYESILGKWDDMERQRGVMDGEAP